MEFHTFGPGLALDPLTMRGIPAMTVYLEDADTGEPVQAYTMDEDAAETTIRTNRFGYFPQFQVSAEVRRLRIVVGEVEMIHGAWELIYKAEASAGDTLLAAQSAQAAAEHAASMIEAPADIKVAELIDTRGTATQRVLHGLYGARGNTFVQPTAPPAGITYEWAGARNNSPSIKKIDGTETARNFDVNGLPHSLDGWEKTSAATITLTEDEGENAIFVAPATPTTNAFYAWQSDLAVDNAGWVAVRAEIKALDQWTADKFRIVIQGSGTDQTVHSRPVEINEFTEIVVTMPVFPGTLRRQFWPVNTTTVEKTGFLVRNSRTGLGQTESEALEQVRNFFDGSTPDDHANDVWFNTADGYLPYFWDSTNKTWFKPV